jgi:type I restriction enzyme M protein
VPPEARWSHLKAQARQPTIGQLVDDAMAGIERDNPALKGVLPKDYARPALDKTRLGQLIDLISNIKVGDEASRAKDVLGRSRQGEAGPLQGGAQLGQPSRPSDHAPAFP